MEARPTWPEELVRVAMGALAIYRMRIVDLFIREHVLLLYIIEGGRHMRVHRGICYFYHDDGAFQAYKGVPPEGTFARVKKFLLQLEGLFRLLPLDTKREDGRLLDAIEACAQSREGHGTYLDRCVDASIFCLGEKRSRYGSGRSRGEGALQADADGVGDDAPTTWNVQIAKALSRVGLQIQNELLGEKLIGYVIEWCETEAQMQPGCCYADTCVLYDAGPGSIVSHVKKGPSNNVYVRIPHPLLDPVSQSNQERLQTFYSQTFWCNLEVFRCCQAAQALAKRLINIDRCFIGCSPGGAGQSLFSSHLDSVYGHNHAFFDPSVWYLDEELRKQVEQFSGCFILTAQEAPETQRRSARTCSRRLLAPTVSPVASPTASLPECWN